MTSETLLTTEDRHRLEELVESREAQLLDGHDETFVHFDTRRSLTASETSVPTISSVEDKRAIEFLAHILSDESWDSIIGYRRNDSVASIVTDDGLELEWFQLRKMATFGLSCIGATSNGDATELRFGFSIHPEQSVYYNPESRRRLTEIGVDAGYESIGAFLDDHFDSIQPPKGNRVEEWKMVDEGYAAIGVNEAYPLSPDGRMMSGDWLPEELHLYGVTNDHFDDYLSFVVEIASE